MSKTIKLSIFALVSTAVLSTSVNANNFKDNEDAIHYRQSAFSLIAHNFGDIGAMIKGKKPYNAEIISTRAANIAALSQLPLEGFINGSDKGETGALAKVWTDKKDFDTQMLTFQKRASTLALTASNGSQSDVKKAFINTAKSCKSCHNAYTKD